ncbi:MAG: ABC transporter substrate-binding protein [Candidatus Pelethousia sp.]|nr:ABC transporter substrate-binding protein [Candidatus Pelethousia sp.]
MTSMDPHVGKEIAAVVVTNNIFGTLLAKDEEGNVIPYIAESWEFVDDVTIDFKIRQGITFHDGSKCTAEDVAYSINRAINSAYVAYIIDYANDAEVLDEYTVRLNLKAPFLGSLVNLTVPFTAIVPKAVVEADPEGFAEHPIGCGPYEFVEWSHGSYCKIKAYDNYFLGKAKTENITFRIIPEAAQRTIALENGEVDLVYDFAVNDIAIINDNPDLQLYQNESVTTWYLALNNNDEILSNAKVRQAIAKAINSQEIIDSVLYGAGSPANSLIPPAVIGYPGEDMPYVAQDIDGAKALLAEAGYPDGLNLKLAVAEDVTRVAVCQVIQAQLAKANINVEIEVCDPSTYTFRANDGEFQMMFFFWICAAGHGDYQMYSLCHSSQQGAAGNRSFYSNPEADKLIMAARQTTDEAVATENYRKLEAILDVDMPTIELLYTKLNVGAGKNVVDFVMDRAGYHNLESVVVYK